MTIRYFHEAARLEAPLRWQGWIRLLGQPRQPGVLGRSRELTLATVFLEAIAAFRRAGWKARPMWKPGIIVTLVVVMVGAQAAAYYLSR
jgi:hypothetical protein